jgi:hypothetical protein
MPSDLNKMMSDVLKDSSEIEKNMRHLLSKYDNLYRESYRQFMEERHASGPAQDLGDFYRLVQTLKRNRDVVGSLMRGINNLRSLSGFKFVIEEDIEKPVAKKMLKNTKISSVPDAERMQEVLQGAMESQVAEGASNA